VHDLAHPLKRDLRLLEFTILWIRITHCTDGEQLDRYIIKTMNQYDIPTGEAAEKTPPPPPPQRGNILVDLFRAHRLGQILILVTVLLSALYISIGSPLSPKPPDTVTITLTWDEWGDLQSATSFIHDEISMTVTLAGDYLSPTTVDQAQSTMDHFDALNQTVIDQTFQQTSDVPDERLALILDNQIDRQQQLVDLLITLNEARLDWLVENLQP
jgi:hypothetical protein